MSGLVFLLGTLLLEWMFGDEVKEVSDYITQAIPFGFTYGFVGWHVMEKRYKNFIDNQ
ncbi:hypothetical protein GS400_12035 [Pontibacillus sp. HMF3514]|nr:hypothetical protein GS400_12035 [Pontibacillus sp. HMF3514]